MPGVARGMSSSPYFSPPPLSYLKLMASRICSLNFFIKGDAKKMTQTLLNIRTFEPKFAYFCVICQKKHTLSFLMSYCRLLWDIWVQIYINFSAKLIFVKSSILSKKTFTSTFNHSNFYSQSLKFLFNLPNNRFFKFSDELL